MPTYSVSLGRSCKVSHDDCTVLFLEERAVANHSNLVSCRWFRKVLVCLSIHGDVFRRRGTLMQSHNHAFLFTHP